MPGKQSKTSLQLLEGAFVVCVDRFVSPHQSYTDPELNANTNMAFGLGVWYGLGILLDTRSGQPPFDPSIVTDHIKILEEEKRELERSNNHNHPSKHEHDRRNGKAKRRKRMNLDDDLLPPEYAADFLGHPGRVENADDPTQIDGQGTSLVVCVLCLTVVAVVPRTHMN